MSNKLTNLVNNELVSIFGGVYGACYCINYIDKTHKRFKNFIAEANLSKEACQKLCKNSDLCIWNNWVQKPNNKLAKIPYSTPTKPFTIHEITF